MKEFKSVELFYEPSCILKKLGGSDLKTEQITEMSDAERGFLCGLIRKHRPRKIVEVGVAEGGTTAVILECIRELELDCLIYSIDALECLWYDETQKTGCVLDKLRENGAGFNNCRHTLFLGKILPEVLGEIGTEIDFLILDTVHTMPGENLDFLSAYPYLSPDAVVVLHDVNLSQRSGFRDSIATNVLFSVVTADKYFNWKLPPEEFPDEAFINIAAFQLNTDTPKYIMDVFAALLLPWAYIPSKEQLTVYGKAIEKLGPQCLELYERAVKEKICKRIKDWQMDFDWTLYRYVLLYGKGYRGTLFLKLCKELGIKVDAFVVSDGHNDADSAKGLPVYEYSSIPFDKKELLIVQTAYSDEISHRLSNSSYPVLNIPENLWGIFELWESFC